jgi:hypothetical protein
MGELLPFDLPSGNLGRNLRTNLDRTEDIRNVFLEVALSSLSPKPIKSVMVFEA